MVELLLAGWAVRAGVEVSRVEESGVQGPKAAVPSGVISGKEDRYGRDVPMLERLPQSASRNGRKSRVCSRGRLLSISALQRGASRDPGIISAVSG